LSYATGRPVGAWTGGHPRERGLPLSLFRGVRAQARPAVESAGRRESVVESPTPTMAAPTAAVLAALLGAAATLAASPAAPGESAARLAPAEAEALVREVSAAVEQLRGPKFKTPVQVEIIDGATARANF